MENTTITTSPVAVCFLTEPIFTEEPEHKKKYQHFTGVCGDALRSLSEFSGLSEYTRLYPSDSLHNLNTAASKQFR